MRIVICALVVALAACGQAAAPAETTTQPAAATPAAAAPPVFTVDPVAFGGMWSFSRNCGGADLVVTNRDATYYDYTDPSNAIAYVGPYAITGNHVVLTLHRLDAHGAPSGDPLVYNLDVSEPVTSDLHAQFGPAGGAMREINAKQCAGEVHD